MEPEAFDPAPGKMFITYQTFVVPTPRHNIAPGLARDKVDFVLAQEAPDILNVNVVQCLGQQRTRPPGIALRRRLIQKSRMRLFVAAP
jgi:hypothetical protein